MIQVTCPKCGRGAERLRKVYGGSYYIHNRRPDPEDPGAYLVETCETHSTGLRQLRKAFEELNNAGMALNAARDSLEKGDPELNFSGALQRLHEVHQKLDFLRTEIETGIGQCDGNDER